MPDLIVYLNEHRKLDGLGEVNQRAFRKFCKLIAGLEANQTLHFSYKIPRSPVHHKFFFWRMKALFDRQEAFALQDHMIAFLLLGANYADFIPGEGGALVAVPRSMSWEALDEQEFTEVKRRVWDYLWTPQAQGALWPHLDAEARHQMVTQWHAEVE